MHRTGKYKRLNLTFGFFPFISATLMALMRENSPPIHQWLAIVRIPHSYKLSNS